MAGLKTIGLLGGTSWPSTVDYYVTLNRLVAARFGGFHSAPIVLNSIDYHDIKTAYETDWPRVRELLKRALHRTLALGPDLLLICNNTLHQAYDELGADIALGAVELVHIVDEVGAEARRRAYRGVLLLGTKRTMENGYYREKLSAQYGLEVAIPDAVDRDTVQRLQRVLAAGHDPAPIRRELAEVLDRYPDHDAVVLACTELPLAIDEQTCRLPILNPTRLQCEAAVRRLT